MGTLTPKKAIGTMTTTIEHWQDQTDIYRSVLKRDLFAFTKLVFRTLYPERPFAENWHHRVIANRLMAVEKGSTKRLIINQPPRTAKSTFCSIAFPLWLLLNKPATEILCISYGDELGRGFAEDCRRFVENQRIQALFPGAWKSAGRNNEIRTGKGGRRYTISAGGAITGQGADVIIIDDPLKASEAGQKQMDNINAWYDANIYQRLNNKNTGAILLVQQRLHLEDLSGHLMSTSNEFDPLVLRSIAEGQERWDLGFGKQHHRGIGEALHPELESIKQLQNLRQRIGGPVFEAQYQQNPAASNQAILQEDWFGRFFEFDMVPINRRERPFEQIVQAWDTASTVRDNSDYSVGVTMGKKDGKFYVLGVFRDKLAFPDLLRKVKEIGEEIEIDGRAQKISNVLIEDANTGTALIQALREERFPVKEVKPNGDKITRLTSVSGIVESGLVSLPQDAVWIDAFLLELCRFPNTKHDDQVDAFAYALDELRQKSTWAYGNLKW